MKITVLNDNRNENQNLKSEHGLSLLIEFNGNCILFDSGETDVFTFNAKKLRVDLNKINAVVLSHGDYDHANGLKYLQLSSKPVLYAHPDIFKYRVSKRTGKFDGINQTEEELKSKFHLRLYDKPVEIFNGVFFLGEIKKYPEFSIGGLPMTDENGNDYPHHDDTALAVKTDKGLVVISGCAHSGICNIIKYATEITREKRIYAVIGGLHFKTVDFKVKEFTDYISKTNAHIYPCHCVSTDTCAYIKDNLQNKTDVLSVGRVIEL